MAPLSQEERLPNLPSKILLKDQNLLLVFAATLVVTSSITAVTPAFPNIVEQLGVSAGAVSLIVTAYTLPAIVLTPILGVFADRHGRKRVLVGSLLIFGLAGGACFFASNFNLLLALRFIQGIGGAALLSTNITIIGDLYEGVSRSKSMGYNATVNGFGSAVYPALGGALALVGWNYPFLIPAPRRSRWNCCSSPFSKSRSPKNKQKLSHYLKGVQEVVKHREVVGLFILTVGDNIAIVGALFTYLPLYLENTYGASALLSGIAISVWAVSFSLGTTFVGKLTEKTSPRLLIKVAFALGALVMVTLPLFGSALWTLLPVALLGLAHALHLSNGQTLLTDAAPSGYRGALVSLQTMVKRVGETTGPLLMAGVYSAFGGAVVFFCGGGRGALDGRGGGVAAQDLVESQCVGLTWSKSE